jgi:hypothetical protein
MTGKLLGVGMIGFTVAYPVHATLTFGQLTIMLGFAILLVFGPKISKHDLAR